MKLGLNRAIGGVICLSRNAPDRLHQIKRLHASGSSPSNIPLAAFTVNVAHGRTRLLGRDGSNPIRVGEEMGQDAAGANADPVIVDIRRVSSWRISDVVG